MSLTELLDECTRLDHKIELRREYEAYLESARREAGMGVRRAAKKRGGPKSFENARRDT